MLSKILKNKIDVFFYATKCGKQPVLEWLKSLDSEDKRILGEDIKTVQFGWPLGMPLVKSLGNGLWEIRSRLKSKKIVRIIFFMYRNKIILLHAFIKKTYKTVNNDINLALKRKFEIENGA